MSSRLRQTISRKACDFCRERKVKCQFQDFSIHSCKVCIEHGILCTHTSDRRRRGRPNKTLQKFQLEQQIQQSSLSPISDRGFPLQTGIATQIPPQHTIPIHQAAFKVLIEHLCPLEIFTTIFQDYLKLIYPISPIIHRPSFMALLSNRHYETDPPFLRLCLSLCAMTVSSMHRNIETYGFGHYRDPKAMVSRAYQLVMASRLASDPEWADNPSTDTLICSLLLGMASHYTESPSRGWVLINESLHCCRALELFQESGYARKGIVEREICKRAFWMLYIIQIHDRVSHVTPHTPLGQDLVLTYWKFLLPLEVEDEDMDKIKISDICSQEYDIKSTHIISGFICLVKVFLCVLGIITEREPSLRKATTTSLFHQPDYFSSRFASSPPALRSEGFEASFGTQSNLQNMMNNLNFVLDDMPELLSGCSSSRSLPHDDLEISLQYNIMNVNIHITKLYLQSVILERCSSSSIATQVVTSPGMEGSWTDGSSVSDDDLWRLREDICKQLLDILESYPIETLESHGTSMVVKIREIAATLLDRNDAAQPTTEVARTSKRYIEAFIEVLTKLDYPSLHRYQNREQLVEETETPVASTWRKTLSY